MSGIVQNEREWMIYHKVETENLQQLLQVFYKQILSAVEENSAGACRNEQA